MTIDIRYFVKRNRLIRRPEFSVFPGGEVHVKVSEDSSNTDNITQHDDVHVMARLRNANSLMGLLGVLNVIRRQNPNSIHLHIPYFPGARQDRVQPGFGFTAKIVADIINSQNLDSVHILDPHSDVTPALLNNCITHSIAYSTLDSRIFSYVPFTTSHAGIICPDAGAVKRTEIFNNTQLPVYYAKKQRDSQTGKLSSFRVESLPESSRPYLIVDDICDGGGTFMGLASIIPKEIKLDLFVTHGIFSKGFTELLGRFRTVITTDSFWSREDIENIPGYDSDRVFVYNFLDETR